MVNGEGRDQMLTITKLVSWLKKNMPKPLRRFLPFLGNFVYIFIQKEIREKVDYEEYWDKKHGVVLNP